MSLKSQAAACRDPGGNTLAEGDEAETSLCYRSLCSQRVDGNKRRHEVWRRHDSYAAVRVPFFYGQPPGLPNPKAQYAGSCDTICWYFGTSFHLWVGRAVDPPVRDAFQAMYSRAFGHACASSSLVQIGYRVFVDINQLLPRAPFPDHDELEADAQAWVRCTCEMCFWQDMEKPSMKWCSGIELKGESVEKVDISATV